MNLPNKLSIVRMCLIPVFVVLFFLPYDFMRFIACGVFIIACLTDALDGYIARKYNMVTTLGNFLDTIADKMLVCCALIAIVTDIHILSTAVVISTMIIISRELMIIGLRTIASSKNIILKADKLGKIKATLQMISLIVLIPYANIYSLNAFVGNIVLYVGVGILLLSVVMAFISAVNYIVSNRQVFKED